MNSDGDKIGLGRFCVIVFPCFQPPPQWVACILVTVAVISSLQGGKKYSIKIFSLSIIPVFLFETKQS